MCFLQTATTERMFVRENASLQNTSQVESSVDKDILSSTLACVLALKRWNIGTKHIQRGLRFIGKYFSVVMDEQIVAPIGFNVIFPGMLSLAIGMGLEFPVRQTHVHGILHLREMELKRLARDKSYGKEAYMAYICEGLGNILDRDKVMKFQRKNGSLFNSPSATSAALIHNYDDKALEYLNSLVSKFGSSVPTVYPINIYCQLSMVDSLEKIGISQHFLNEIKGILDVTYSLWLHRDEEIMLDVETCAMAFRLLRMNGYGVSSDELSHVYEASTFHNSLQGYLSDTESIMELYKASKVEYALKFPFYATMEHLDHKRNIEHFDTRGSRMLKTEYMKCRVNQDFLALAVEDFTLSQSIYQDELLHLRRWAKDHKLDKLQFVRQKLTYCYLAAAATLFPPELSDARISWAKNSVLATAADDFFDIVGSKEELENLVALVEKWDEHSKDEFYSEQVKILFCAIYTTVNQLGALASAVQNRDVKKHMIELWVQLLRSMMTEAEWRMRRYVPTIEEYVENAVVSFALGPIVLITMYFVGQKLFGCVVKDEEYNTLFRLMSKCGRLLNDIQGFEVFGPFYS
uniref:Ent-kaur-16-ene synthase, chloroplastic n=1 Tax=Aegilops tauschii TaxID=37682 RepID=M8BJR4_AEGTA